MRHIFFSFMLAFTTICQASPNFTTSVCNCDLPAPQNLKLEEVGTTYATLRWNAVAGAVGYQISLLDTLGNLVSSETTTQTALLGEDLEPGLFYEYRVAAICLGGGISTLFSSVPFKPLVVDLVISLEKPKGFGQVVCQKDISPNANCAFEIPVNQNVIAEIKRKSTGESVFFKVKFDLINSYVPRLTLSKVSEEFYPGKSFEKPKIYSNNNKLADKNILFSYVSILNNTKLCYINFEQPNSSLYSFNIVINQPFYEDLQFKLYSGSGNFYKEPDFSEQRFDKTNSELFTFFPNPTSNSIIIYLDNFENLDHKATIYNPDGFIISDFTLSPGENYLDISNLRPGIYFCRIDGINDNQPFKIVKME